MSFKDRELTDLRVYVVSCDNTPILACDVFYDAVCAAERHARELCKNADGQSFEQMAILVPGADTTELVGHFASWDQYDEHEGRAQLSVFRHHKAARSLYEAVFGGAGTVVKSVYGSLQVHAVDLGLFAHRATALTPASPVQTRTHRAKAVAVGEELCTSGKYARKLSSSSSSLDSDGDETWRE